MDEELRTALLGMETRLNDRFDAEHDAVMARFDTEREVTTARFDAERATTTARFDSLMARLDSNRIAIMARLDRMEDKVNNLDAKFTFNNELVATIVAELESRRAQIGLLQDAIRAGMNAESEQLGSMRKLVVGMQALMHRLQSQVDIIHDRLDHQTPRQATQGP